MRIFPAFIFTGFITCFSAVSQTPPATDISGNALLNGVYNFRQISYYVSNPAGTLSRSTAISGAIAFDGAGAYSITGSLLDSTAPTAASTPYTTTGTYAIGASGQGTISGPLAAADRIYGLVSNGIFIGSSTASNFNDLFIAAPATPTATVATLQGTYSIASLEFPGTDPTAALSAWFQVDADGKGNLNALTVNGHVAGAAGTLVTQSIPAVTYSFSNGTGTIAYPSLAERSATAVLVQGNQTLYVSPDGKFVFGGSSTGWDMFIGVNAVLPAPSTQTFTGLYYQAGLDEDVSQLASGAVTLAGYYGSLNTSLGLTIAHQHLNSMPISTPYDYTFADSYTANSDGSYSDATLGATYIIGSNGIRIGYDVGSALGINIAIPAPVLTGAGVFLNPQGVVNAASYAPFTAAISPGELISLFGTNLSATTQGATAVPVSGELGSVQVMINGLAAPVVYASPTLVSAIVPYGVTTSTVSPNLMDLLSTASVEVVNDGVASNIVTMSLSTTSPGIFTYPADGLGNGAVLHLDYSLVSTANPATTGETLAVFVDGLGAVSPAAIAGAAGPSTTLSETPGGSIGMLIDGQLATVSYAGLAPGFAGLYQINVVVPSGIHSGSVSLAVAGPDSLTSEALIAIAAGTGTIGTAVLNGKAANLAKVQH